jgi:hypothetical protein
MWLVGLFSALAAGCRPTAFFTTLFFPLHEWMKPAGKRVALAGLAPFFAGPALMVAALAAYNLARFGNPFDFGYDRMILDAPGSGILARYGQFDLRMIPTNLYWFFLAAPEPKLHPPWYVPSQNGMSLFLATPAFFLIFVAPLRQPLVRAAWIAMLLCLVPLLMYFNPGFAQFGHRFGMDYLILLLILLLIAAGRRSAIFAGLATLSIAIQMWGIASFWTATR